MSRMSLAVIAVLSSESKRPETFKLNFFRESRGSGSVLNTLVLGVAASLRVKNFNGLRRISQTRLALALAIEPNLVAEGRAGSFALGIQVGIFPGQQRQLPAL